MSIDPLDQPANARIYAIKRAWEAAQGLEDMQSDGVDLEVVKNQAEVVTAWATLADALRPISV